ncbi:MAG TPA: hypothetical protein VKQ27_03395 [Acetobacteraceae bacterium]|nr:hypothetical protein [Acetobacteraceae bacterium]
MPAHDLEAAIILWVKSLLLDRRLVSGLIETDASALASLLQRASSIAAQLETHHGGRTLVGKLAHQVRVEDEQIAIDIDCNALRRVLGLQTQSEAAILTITTPAVRIRRGKDVKLVLANHDGDATERDPTLVALLGEARDVRDAALAAPDLSMKAIAVQMGEWRTRATRQMRIAWLAPEIVEAISEGRHPPRLTPA